MTTIKKYKILTPIPEGMGWGSALAEMYQKEGFFENIQEATYRGWVGDQKTPHDAKWLTWEVYGTPAQITILMLKHNYLIDHESV